MLLISYSQDNVKDPVHAYVMMCDWIRLVNAKLMDVITKNNHHVKLLMILVVVSFAYPVAVYMPSPPFFYQCARIDASLLQPSLGYNTWV